MNNKIIFYTESTKKTNTIIESYPSLKPLTMCYISTYNRRIVSCINNNLRYSNNVFQMKYV